MFAFDTSSTQFLKVLSLICGSMFYEQGKNPKCDIVFSSKCSLSRECESKVKDVAFNVKKSLLIFEELAALRLKHVRNVSFINRRLSSRDRRKTIKPVISDTSHREFFHRGCEVSGVLKPCVSTSNY